MGGGICRLVSPVGLVPDVRHQGIGVHLGPGGVHCGALPVADLSIHHRQTGVRELIGAGGEGQQFVAILHIHPGVDEGTVVDFIYKFIKIVFIRCI